MAESAEAPAPGAERTLETTDTPSTEARSRDDVAPDDGTARILENIAEPAAEPPAGLAPFFTAEVVGLDGRRAAVRTRRHAPFWIALDDDVDVEVIELCMTNKDAAIVETDEGTPRLVGVAQRKVPRRAVLHGDEVSIRGRREILMQSGEAAVRLREDGEVEVGGSRIVAMSKGLFKIVGRMLRLN